MKRKILIVTAILMMTTAFLAGFELTDEVIAFRALEEGNYQGALEIYVKNNNNSGAGMAYLGLKRFDDAKEKFEKAGDQSGIGLAYCGKHLYDDAIKNFEQKKDNSGIGLAYCGKRDFDAARGYFKQANDYSGMGLAALGENKTDEAREWFTKVGDKGGLGLVLLAEKKYDDALKSFVAIKDNSGAGHAYCGKKDYSSAMTYFKKANDLSGLSLAYSGKNMYTEAIRYAIEANDYSALGHAYLGKHDYKEALDSFTKANDLSGIGFVYCKQKDFTKAAQYAKAANDLSLQGQIYLGAGDYKSAEDCFTAANDLSGLGLVNLKNKKYDKAKELFQKANDMSGLGFLYGEIGDYSKSEECFTKANDMSGLGRMALKRKQFNEAIAYFTKANDLDALGDLYWQLRGFDKAIECFKAEGDDVKVVQALREKKRRDPITKKVSYYGAEEAIAYAKAKIEEGKFVAPLHIEIGHIYSSRNDFENALKEYEAALNSDTYYAADALFWIGKTRYQQKNYQLAKEVFSSLVLKYPYHRLSYEARGAIKYLERSGKSSASLPANNICGPYALKLLLGNYGIEAATDDIAKAAGTDKEGTTMLGLIQAAKLSGLELSAFKTDSGKLNGYAGKAVLFINNSHYVFLKEVKAAGVLVTDNIADAYMTFSALDRCWQGQIIAVKTDPDIKEFAYDELVNIKGGNRRASEGGTTKNDPGLYPNGSLTLDYGKIGPIVPGDYLMMNNLSDSGTGHNPQPDGGMGITRMGTGENALGGQQCDAVFDPIAITGGQVIIPKEDIFIPCRGRKHGINLSLKRTYSSSSEVEGKMGFGWALAHDVKLLVVEAHDDDPEYVVVTAPDGTVFSYEYDGNGYYYQPECDGSYVLKNEDGTYYWMRRTVMYGTQKYYFEKYITETTTHRIKKIEDLNGNYLIYIYSGANLLRIFDNNSRYLYFTYLNGKISSVTGGTGSFYVTYNYGYDEDDNLTSVTGPEDYSETYEYEDASNIHNITAYVDAEGNRTVYTYEMDPSGISDVCVDVEDALGNHATYDYLFEIGVTTVVDARGRTSTYEYEKGKITKITNSNGEITNYSFDDAYMRNSITDEHSRGCGWSNKYHYGLVETLDNEEGHSAYFSYNSFNYIEWIVDAKTRTWSYEYDANGNLRYRHTLAPNNQGISTVEKQYNQYGCLTAVIDPENITTTYTYDSKGNILSETDGTGNYIGYTYDNLGRMTSSKYGDLGGYDTATTYDYDGLGRLIKKTYPDQSYEEYTYDKNSNLLTFTDANNHQTAYEYNALNQCVKVTDPESKITEYDYDAFGNMTELTRYVSGNPLTTYYEYNDHYNRLTKVTDPTGEMTVFTYEDSPPLLGDSKNYTTMKKYKPDNSLLAVETRTFDPMYRIKTVKDGLNNITTYNYDEVGNLISVVDQNEHTTTYTYDPNVNVVLTETDPLNNSTSYTYYKNGKLKTKTDANGNTTTYTYDAAGKLSLVTYEDDSTVEYAYNKYGKIFAMVDSLGTTVYSYNTRTWLTSVDGPNMNDTVSYTYDYAGNRATMVTPAGNFSYAYYANNLPYTLTNPQSQTTTFIYDTANRLTRMNYYNSTYTEWTYYNNDRVDTVTLKDGSQTTLASYNYDYSSLGKIATVTDNLSNTYNFTYNDAGRLTHEDKKDSQNNVIFGRDYSYDNAGNRTSETRDGVSVTLTYNNANQLTSRVTYSQTIT
ncbi:MAG: cysteine peptidase family C39 domain-containing protein, partial [Candidatus Omnitrophota bacterium]